MGIFKPNIEKLKAKKNVEGLIKALQHKDRFVRGDAVDALGEIKDARAIEALIQALKGEWENYVSSRIIDVLGGMERPPIETLNQLLKNNRSLLDSRVVEQVIDLLGQKGNKGAVEPLIQIAKDEYEDGWTRNHAVEALGKIGDRRAVEPLIQILKQDPGTEGTVPYVSAAAELAKIGSLRVAETIIDWLFKFTSNDKQLNVMKNLFKDYTPLILEASSYYDEWEEGTQVINLDAGNKAIQKLCHIRTSISSNILHKVAQKKNAKVESYDHEGRGRDETLSFKSQRKVAREELKRRGNPCYDPSVYLVKKHGNYEQNKRPTVYKEV